MSKMNVEDKYCSILNDISPIKIIQTLHIVTLQILRAALLVFETNYAFMVILLV